MKKTTQFLFTLSTPCVIAHTDDYETYYATTWIVSSLLFIMYLGVITASFRYMRPRIPLVALVFVFFLPPIFFFVLLLLSLTTQTTQPQLTELETEASRRRVPRSRNDLRV